MKARTILLAACLVIGVNFAAQAQNENSESATAAAGRERAWENRRGIKDFARERETFRQSFREERPEADSSRSALRDGRDSRRPAVGHLAMHRSFGRPGPAAARIRPENPERPERPMRPGRTGIENLENADVSERVNNTKARRRRPIVGVLEGKDISSLLKGATIELPVLEVGTSLLS